MSSGTLLDSEALESRLQRDPNFALIIGLGYSNSQKRCQVYRHLQRLLEDLRSITQGDVRKAKYLSKMLFERTHAGSFAFHQMLVVFWCRPYSI